MKNVIQGTTLSGTGAVTIAPGAEITIRNPAGQLVPLWADRAGTQPHDNPFLTDSEGNFRVYADSGWVHIRAQKDGSVREWRYVPLGSAAAMDIGEVYAALGSEVYSSVSEGLSNSAEGDYFLVESSGSLDLYLVVNGVAEQRAAGIDDNTILATRAYADGVAAEAESNATNAAVAAASAAYQQATEYSDSQLQTHRESGDHDHRYYTKTEVDQALSTKVDDDDPRLSDPREWTAEVVSQPEAEAGTSSVPRKWTAQRVRQAIVAAYNALTSAFGRTLANASSADAARSTLGLGTAATRDVTTSKTDTTEGRVLKVGDGGILARPPGGGSFDFDDPEQPTHLAEYIVNNATGLTPPGVSGGTVLRQAYRVGVGKRWYSDLVIANADRDGRVLSRAVGHDGTQITEDTGWREHYHTGNIAKLISDGNLVRSSDLGTAATRDVTTSKTDTTEGRVLKVGDGGWLGRASPSSYIAGYPTSTAQNVSQVYRREEIDGSVAAFAASIHFASQDTWGRLRIAYRNDDRRAWIQGGLAPSGSGWTEELYHTGNINKLISDLNLDDPIGVGQTWLHMTAQRAWNTTYTNTTGRLIAVFIRAGSPSGRAIITLYIAGSPFVSPLSAGDNNLSTSIFAIIPPGAAYQATSDNNLIHWAELR